MESNELAQKEIEEILKKYGLQLGYKFDFPVYRIVPDEVKLALNILGKHKMRVSLDLQPKK